MDDDNDDDEGGTMRSEEAKEDIFWDQKMTLPWYTY